MDSLQMHEVLFEVLLHMPLAEQMVRILEL
jgi:hypothetical protein